MSTTGSSTGSTTGPPPAPSSPPPPLPFWMRGDMNAFFGLGFNVLVNVLVLSGLCIGVVQLPAGDVMGTILPALGIALVIGNVYYTLLARRLARREGRRNVTAMPYGPSVPHMFIVVFVIMLPVYLQTKDPIRAWQAGVAWAFIIGVIVLLGAFVGPTIRRYAPRAALLGTLAGISIAFISMRPAAQMWEAAWVPGRGAAPRQHPDRPGRVARRDGDRLGGRLPVRARRVGRRPRRRPRRPGSQARPAARRAVERGTAAGDRDPAGRLQLHRGANVESAAAAGDSYNLRSVLLADGAGAVVGSAFGSPFPPAVYIGHPGWKDAGGRSGYSLATGVVIGLMCFLGLFGVLGALLPMPAIVPILLYIGLMIGAQAFQAVPRIHAAAVVAALIPNIASWATGLMDNVLSAAGTSATQVGYDKIAGAGVVYEGTKILGEGAILAGLILGAIVAFIIDRRFVAAAVFAGVGAVLSWIGLIHAPQVSWGADPQVALGYAFAALTCLAFAALRLPPRDTGDDDVPAEDDVRPDGARPDGEARQVVAERR